MELILASASPRRRALLARITPHFTACAIETDESLLPGAPLADEVVRLAQRKAQGARARFPHAICIGADTLVTLDGAALGKPRDDTEAAHMLGRLCGRTHEVMTGVAVLSDAGTHTLCVRTKVHMRAFSNEELWRYVHTGEPRDKAGAYGIQGEGALLIDGIEGDFYAVMGLPLSPLCTILHTLGVYPPLDRAPALVSDAAERG